MLLIDVSSIRYNSYMNTEKAEKGVKYLLMFFVAVAILAAILA